MIMNKETDMAMSARTPDLRARLADGSLARAWLLDPARSTVSLHSRGMWGLLPVTGLFTDVAGAGVMAPDGRIRGRIAVTAASIDTGHTQRDEHLRSADFLHSGAHPDIVFTAERLTHAGDQATISGTLQVRGRTRPLTVPVTITLSEDDEIHIDAEVRIDRFDFGLTWNRMGMAARNSTISISAVFVGR